MTPAVCSIQLYTMILMYTWNVTSETGIVFPPLLVCILIHSVFASDGKRRTLEGWSKREAIESVSRKIFCWTCRPKVECTCDNKGKKVFVRVQMGMKICSGLEERALFFKSPTSWKIGFQEVIAWYVALSKAIYGDEICSHYEIYKSDSSRTDMHESICRAVAKPLVLSPFLLTTDLKVKLSPWLIKRSDMKNCGGMEL